MAIKISLGKLTLGQPFEAFITEQLARNAIGLLSINLEHTAAVINLPFHHRDPFDRLLLAQAQVENLPFISSDPAFDAYGVQRIW
jgi:PIN domain nuclease of toxin-antitoxin system